MKSQSIAEKHSANCFLNSLFREWNEFYHDKESSSFIVHLKNHDSLIIPLTYFSLTGRHEYADVFFIKNHKTDALSEIDFLEENERVFHPSILFKAHHSFIELFFHDAKLLTKELNSF